MLSIPKSNFLVDFVYWATCPNLVQEWTGGDAQRPTATQTNGDRHAGRIPRGIDGFAKTLGEFRCPTESVSLLRAG